MRDGFGLVMEPRLNLLPGLPLQGHHLEDLGDRIVQRVRREATEFLHAEGVRVFVQIGTGSLVAQNVTIGTAGKGESRGAPTIGNRVFIGTHSVIVGKIQIGEDAMICAGSVVTRSVAPRAVLVGNPARSAIASSPPLHTSRLSPSSATHLATSTQRKALAA